jgi:hypothetical protein
MTEYNHDDATRQDYFRAHLATDDDREWNSLHSTWEDAERQLKAVGAAWGVEFTPDGEPAFGYERYVIERLPVLGPEESGEAPAEPIEIPLTKEEDVTWTWLADRDVPGGLSADEMADDFGITRYVAARRLITVTARGAGPRGESWSLPGWHEGRVTNARRPRRGIASDLTEAIRKAKGGHPDIDQERRLWQTKSRLPEPPPDDGGGGC